MTVAFDLFQGLASLGRKDLGWFSSLTPEGQKAAAPFVLMRWMAGTSDRQQILRLNTAANMYMFAGSADKSALLKLLAVSATGKNIRYSWLKGPGAKSKNSVIEVIKQYYDCSTREAQTYNVKSEDLIQMGEELGWDREQLAKLKKELDDGQGRAETAVSKAPKRGKSK